MAPAMQALTWGLFQMFGVGSIPWSPLGCGLLTRVTRDATHRGKTDTFAPVYDMPFLGELTSRYVRLHAHTRKSPLTIGYPGSMNWRRRRASAWRRLRLLGCSRSLA